MPKPKPIEALVKKKIYVPEELKAEITKLLHDPLTGRTTYGGLAGLMRGLFTNWINSLPKDFTAEPVNSQGNNNREQLVFDLPPQMARQLGVLLLDPKTGRAAYGAFSKLGSDLLQEWIDEKTKD